MPLSQTNALALIRRRHPEWREHQRAWRWLADSYEGGDRYRYADYHAAPDKPAGSGESWFPRGPMDPQTGVSQKFTYSDVVDRNLIPHRQEMDDDGFHLYAMRISRTPVPEILATTVETHLSKIYGRDVRREGPTELTDWWANVDGAGTDVEQWVTETVAPLLLVLGQLDICCEHPEAPEGAVVETRADTLSLGLSGAVARIILPENVVWWKLDEQHRYRELLVCERDEDGSVRWRHWTETESNLYTAGGSLVPKHSGKHPFGRPPVVRVFDRRKPRCCNVGRPRYQAVADLQKCVYNGWSEVILSDTQQTHAQLCVPEEYTGADSQIPVGDSGFVLPMKPMMGSSGQIAGYQSPTWLDPPKGSIDSVQRHVEYFQDQANLAGSLAKPAGMAAQTTTAQSGISKIADQQDGNAVLGRVAEVLENAERSVAALALLVLRDSEPDAALLGQVLVEYPRQFDLFSAADVAQVLDAVQRGAQQAGALPLTERALLDRLVTLILPGLDEDAADAIQKEIEAFTAAAGTEYQTRPEPQPVPVPVDPNMQPMPDPAQEVANG